MSKVAVLMSAYNEAQFIEESIQSALNQTHKETYLFIYNDGSTDETRSILDKYEENKRIGMLQDTVNHGCSKRLNDLCHYNLLNHFQDVTYFDYVALCDSSDLYYPDKLEKQVKYADEHPECVIVSTWYEEIDLSGKHIQDVKIPEIDDLSIKRLAYFADRQSGAPSLYRFDALKEVGFWDENLKECYDTDLHLRLMRIGKVATIPEILYKYRVDQSKRKSKADVWTWWFKRIRYKMYCEQIGIPFDIDAYKEGWFGS